MEIAAAVIYRYVKLGEQKQNVSAVGTFCFLLQIEKKD